MIASLRDVALIARFHLVRAVRSRALVASWVLYLLVVTGTDWLFTRILLQIENQAARALGVPSTDRPGALLHVLRDNGELQNLWNGLFADADLARRMLDAPFLAVVHLWVGIGVLPFLASAAGAETLSGDLRDRTLRFEVVRTGRMEIVGGRLLGQIVAVWAGVVASALGTVLVDALTMARPEAPRLAWTLGTDLPALLLWALPWVGLGVASSSVTRAPAIARTLAPALAFLGWVLWGLSQADGGPRAPLLRSAAEAVLPQGQLSALLRGGWDLAAAAVVLSAMAVVWAYLSWPHFRRRDL